MKWKRLNLPPLTNPLVAIADVDNPVIVVTIVAIVITRTDRPLGRKKRNWEYMYSYLNLPLSRTCWVWILWIYKLKIGYFYSHFWKTKPELCKKKN